MKTLFTLLFLVFGLLPALHSQEVEYLNANNVNAGIGIGGNLFSRLDSLSSTTVGNTTNKWGLFEVTKGSDKRSVFTASLWLSGLIGPVAYCEAERYGPSGYDGPVALVYDSLYDNYYKRVFKITKTKVQAHLALSFPAQPSQVDNALLKWPAIGNPYVASVFGVNIADPLAPFIDTDHDGIYDATKGDYPRFCGEEAIFFVYNDMRSKNPWALGAEVRGLAENFIDTSGNVMKLEKRVINNTIFVSYEVENKSARVLSNFYNGMFEDIDLGCFSNDRIGCDTLLNLMFVYNGTFPDLNCNGVQGYQKDKVAHGAIALNNPMAAFGYFNNDGGPQGDPFACSQYRNYMQGYWKDGSPFHTGSDGGNTALLPRTKFLYPNSPSDTSATAWSEVHDPNGGSAITAGDRRMYSSAGPSDFLPGEIKKLDYAFFTSYDSTAASILTIVDTLKHDADRLQQFYNQVQLCRSEQIALSSHDMPSDKFGVTIFPNPTHTQLSIVSPQKIESLQLFDLQGRLVATKTVMNERPLLDVSVFSKGVYLLKVNAEQNTALKKVIIE